MATPSKTASTFIDLEEATASPISSAYIDPLESVAPRFAGAETDNGFVDYDLYDSFQVVRAAGAIDGTAAEPGPGTRTVVDTDSKLTINADLEFVPHTTPAWGDPGLWYGSVNRTAGLTLIARLTLTDSVSWQFGFDSDQTGTLLRAYFTMSATSFGCRDGGVGPINGATLSTSTDYDLAVAVRAAGAYFFIRGGAYKRWSLVWIGDSNASATLYPCIITNDTTFDVASMRIPTTRWLPDPLVSDGFSTSTSDGLGHAETSGAGSGGDGVTWLGSTWSNSSGSRINTPGVGADVVTNGLFENWSSSTDADNWDENTSGSSAINRESTIVHTGTYAVNFDVQDAACFLDQDGIFTIGTWYRLNYHVRNDNTSKNAYVLFGLYSVNGGETDQTYSSRQVTGRATGTDFRISRNSSGTYNLYIDNLSIEPINTEDLFNIVRYSTCDVFVDVEVTITKKCQGGFVLNLDVESNPKNFVIIYIYDADTVKVEKCLSGTYTEVSSNSITYGAGNVLRVIKRGDEYRVYYDGSLITADTISDAAIVSNTKHGLFSTNDETTFDNFVCHAQGAENEHDWLNIN